MNKQPSIAFRWNALSKPELTRGFTPGFTKVTRLAGALALVLFAASAQAAATSSASLGPISITTEGGSVTFYTNTDPYTNTSASTNAYNSSTGEEVDDTQYADSNYGSLNSESAVTNAGATASVLASADTTSPAGASFSASGYSNGTDEATTFSYYGAASAPDNMQWTMFTISAHTSVTFSALATVSAATTVGWDDADGGEVAVAYTFISAYIQDSGYLPEVNYLQIANSELEPDLVYGELYYTSSTTESGMLEISLSNNSDEVQTGYFLAYASAAGWSYQITAVPEPDSYAILLAGLGLMGFVARRRAKQLLA